MTVQISNIQSSGHAEEFNGKEAGNWIGYMFRVGFTLSDGKAKSNHSVGVLVTTPAGDGKPSMRAHLHMNSVAFQAARTRIVALLESDGPRAVAELTRIDLRGQL